MFSSSTPHSSGEFLVSNASSSLPRSHNNFNVSNENTSYSSLSNQQSPSQRSQTNHHHHHHPSADNGRDFTNIHPAATEQQAQKTSKTRRQCRSHHSCNPCMGHFITKRDKSADKDVVDNASLDAYDLASPCCDPNCVPVKRRSRHHKEHHHKHKHRDKDKEKPPRPRSQSHVSPQMQSANVHYDTGGNHVVRKLFKSFMQSVVMHSFYFSTTTITTI